MPLQWNFADLGDRLADLFRSAEQELRLEQAVYGLDSRDERALQELLAERLSPHYQVAREIPYPGSVGKKLTHRQRCDLVLSLKGRPLKLDFAPETLFDPPNLAKPEDALWLEVKIAYQFREGGIRHGGYGNQWRNAVVEDLRKMEADENIREVYMTVALHPERMKMEMTLG